MQRFCAWFTCDHVCDGLFLQIANCKKDILGYYWCNKYWIQSTIIFKKTHDVNYNGDIKMFSVRTIKKHWNKEWKNDNIQNKFNTASNMSVSK